MNEFSKSEEDAAPVAEQEEENVVTIPPQLTEKVANRGEPLEDATVVEDTVKSADVSREDAQVEVVEPVKLPEPRRSARIAGGKVRTGPVTYKAFHTSVRIAKVSRSMATKRTRRSLLNYVNFYKRKKPWSRF
jgi:hypothetical protein